MSIVLLTQTEAAKLLRCSTAKVARERRAGRLAYLPGRPVMLRLEDLLDWLERRRVTVKGAEAQAMKYNAKLAARRAVLKRRTPHHHA